eukprot:TRINITY_DN2781_c0_g1_i5.p1 TRINITY_DN2781_c0_g1~~TRINITY_DN2781_c0_g1_i5.p1  ORF type:complete len:214 (-),score=33.33 TRINITY_DN2781_c0_g1_i5:139-780(-)
MNSYTYLFKYTLIGDSSVGKSCLLLQFVDKRFKDDADTTVGVEFGSKFHTISNRTLKLQVWDTAGQESFRSITRSYYRGSIGAFLVYDITRRDTFEHCIQWLDELRAYGDQTINVMLLGNKCDLVEERQVSYEEGRAFAEEKGCLFMETSAKTAMNVDEAFLQMSEVILNKIDREEIDPEDETIGIKLGGNSTKNHVQLVWNNSGTKKKFGCC